MVKQNFNRVAINSYSSFTHWIVLWIGFTSHLYYNPYTQIISPSCSILQQFQHGCYVTHIHTLCTGQFMPYFCLICRLLCHIIGKRRRRGRDRKWWLLAVNTAWQHTGGIVWHAVSLVTFSPHDLSCNTVKADSCLSLRTPPLPDPRLVASARLRLDLVSGGVVHTATTSGLLICLSQSSVWMYPSHSVCRLFQIATNSEKRGKRVSRRFIAQLKDVNGFTEWVDVAYFINQGPRRDLTFLQRL